MSYSAEKRLAAAQKLEGAAHEPGGTGHMWRCPMCNVLRSDRRPAARCKHDGHQAPEWVTVVVAAPIRAALEFYANGEHYEQPRPFATPFVEVDRGSIARAAIKGMHA